MVIRHPGLTPSPGPGPHEGEPQLAPRHATTHAATRQEAAVRGRARGSWPLLVLADLWILPLAATLGLAPLHVVVLVGLVLCAHQRMVGMYLQRLTEDVLDDLPRLVLGVLTSIGLVAALLHEALPRAVSLALLLLLGVIVGRTLAYGVRRRRTAGARVLVVGDGPAAAAVARSIADDPYRSVTLVGLVGEHHEPAELNLPVLGRSADLAEILSRGGVSVVVLAFLSTDELQVVRALRRRHPDGLQIFGVPAGYALRPRLHGGSDQLSGVPLIHLEPARPSGGGHVLKRGLDIVLASVALVLLAPVMLAVAVAVRRELGPGVIFRQERIGQHGVAFTLYKFTSLRPADPADSDTRWSIRGDERLGPVARFIRATSLDELPQLVNVLRGDMSVVGPRPERPFFVERYRSLYPHYDDRHRARSGLTGLAAVRGLRGDTSIRDRARYDNSYIDGWSLWGDIKIMVRTVGVVVGRRGR